MRDAIPKEAPTDFAAIGTALRRWYGRNARVLPWRVGPAESAAGIRPDPYRVWLSEIMLQQTTVAAVRGYFGAFTSRWPTVADLAAADDGEVMAAWAGLGYYARARNLLACARAVAGSQSGSFPETPDGLRLLPGIGPYTAAAIAAIAFDRPAVVVDGNVERVVARVFGVDTPLPAAKPVLTQLAARLTPDIQPGDHAQAMMDLGATVCTPRKPACGLCPLRPWCSAFALGNAETLPRKAPKPEKPVRHGIAYVAERQDGAILVERRPDRGLLGGMLGFPASAWLEALPDPAAPCEADWRPAPTSVRHTFTHFHLELRVMTARVGHGTQAQRGWFLPRNEFRPRDLPTVMRKAWDAASRQLRTD